MLKSKTLKINSENDLMFITFPNLSETGLVRHAFSTRLGGVSHGIYRSMNLSPSNGDDRKNVLKNYEILCNAIGADYKKCVLSHQTHTVNLRVVNENDIGKGIFCARDYDDVDGLITNVPGVVLVTQYADCVPLL
ncbi:MAG: laccase domain-containing protein, partial [Oscillospiraceae bacterium]